MPTARTSRNEGIRKNTPEMREEQTQWRSWLTERAKQNFPDPDTDRTHPDVNVNMQKDPDPNYDTTPAKSPHLPVLPLPVRQ